MKTPFTFSRRSISFRMGVFLLLAGLVSGVAYAINILSEGYRVNSNTTTQIDATPIGGDCKSVVTPNNGIDRFVPTKTLTEWNAFKAAAPGLGLTLNACPVNCSYTTYQGGSCSVSCGGGNYATYYTKTVVESGGGTCPISEGQFAGYSGGACNTQSCSYTLNLTIASSVQNYNLRSAAIAAGWNGSTPLAVTVTVNAGVYVGSSSTASHAFDTGTPFPAGSTLALVNNGFIIGMGGQGGWGAGYHDVSGDAYHAATGGSAGGPAFIARHAITVTNNGTIGGGGGGGGGGSAYPGYWRGGSGGGGGRGYSGGSGYSGAGNAYVGWAPSGGSGGPTAAGAGGAGVWQLQTCTTDEYGTTTCSPQWGGQAGGNGGGLGQAGASGVGGGTWFGPAGGGAGGTAVNGNANVTWAVVGTRAGLVQ